jgi:hypothetical protein
MHGRAASIVCLCLLGAVAFHGCDEARLATYFGDEETAADSPPTSVAFDPAAAGKITGRVTWAGPAPRVSPFRAPVSPLSEQPTGPRLDWPNPHAPAVNPRGGGVADAVVFLRDVDRARARPWDHPPVRVSVRGRRYHILQGDADALTGFVRRGDEVTILSEDGFQAVQARGAAFFTLTLPDRDRPLLRKLARSGVVELSSNAGQFWMRAHLFVADHPYLARTDAEGRFALEQVPPGRYELACWLPDWHEASHERDGETTLISRITFGPSVVKLRDVTVERGRPLEAGFVYEEGDFGR